MAARTRIAAGHQLLEGTLPPPTLPSPFYMFGSLGPLVIDVPSHSHYYTGIQVGDKYSWYQVRELSATTEIATKKSVHHIHNSINSDLTPISYELLESRFCVFSILGTTPKRVLPWSQIA